ncbi:MAG: SIMPL domain-containing protein, partial [Pseudomonadota bacterium]
MLRHIVFLTTTALVLTGCLPEAKPPTITVVGKATIEIEPDEFGFVAFATGQGTTQQEALEKITAQTDEIEEQMKSLTGLESLSVTTSDFEVKPVPSEECKEINSYRSDQFCEPVSYAAYMEINVTGSPANLAGNAVSLATELINGPTTFAYFSVSDRTAATNKAMEAAVQAGQDQAERIAAASSLTVGNMVEAQPVVEEQ